MRSKTSYILIVILVCLLAVSSVGNCFLLIRNNINDNDQRIKSLEFENDYLSSKLSESNVMMTSFLSYINENKLSFHLLDSYNSTTSTIRKVEFPDEVKNYILDSDSRLFLAPLISSPILSKLDKGTEVFINEIWEVNSYGNSVTWCNVDFNSYGNDQPLVGWIPKDVLVLKSEGEEYLKEVKIKNSSTIYHATDLEFDLSYPNTAAWDYQGFVIKYREEYVLILTIEDELYWVHINDIYQE